MAENRDLHPFFKSNNIHGNIAFNFYKPPISNLSAFALGYHEAGKVLISKMEASGGYPDYDGYPIMFLYRHSLELYLKAIICKGAFIRKYISNEDVDIRKLLYKHELSPFLPVLKAIFDDMEWEWNFNVSGLKSFTDFEELIRSIDQIGPRSYCFRYPIDKRRESPFPKNFVINVIAFAKNMDPILDLLYGAVEGIEDRTELAAEVQNLLDGLLNEDDSGA